MNIIKFSIACLLALASFTFAQTNDELGAEWGERFDDMAYREATGQSDRGQYIKNSWAIDTLIENIERDTSTNILRTGSYDQTRQSWWEVDDVNQSDQYLHSPASAADAPATDQNQVEGPSDAQ